MRRIPLTAAAALLACLLLTNIGSSQGQERQLLPFKGWGRVTGRVTFKGTLPDPSNVAEKMAAHSDKHCCLDKGAKAIETIDNTWIVDAKTQGVKNVLVYLIAPKGTYFPIHEADKQRKEIIDLDQPHCMFVPHVVALYPSYFDGSKDVPTGQQFLIKNSAPVPHNTRAVGDQLKNPGFNITLPPGGQKPTELKPQRLPVMIQCDIHPWMSAKVGVYDHPYFAITKEDGSFTIPRVPAGAEVTLMGWHEGVGFVERIDGKYGRSITFQPGENKVELTITPK
jgi:hypothetical protein